MSEIIINKNRLEIEDDVCNIDFYNWCNGIHFEIWLKYKEDRLYRPQPNFIKITESD